MRLTVPGVLVLLSILPGCLTIPTIGTGIPCQALEPITFSGMRDDPLTVRQIREFNAVLDELCPEGR